MKEDHILYNKIFFIYAYQIDEAIWIIACWCVLWSDCICYNHDAKIYIFYDVQVKRLEKCGILLMHENYIVASATVYTLIENSCHN